MLSASWKYGKGWGCDPTIVRSCLRFEFAGDFHQSNVENIGSVVIPE